MRKLLTVILIVSIFAPGCRQRKFEPDYSGFLHVVRKGKFELYVPGDMRPDKKLNSRADLQYADSSNTLFLLVIREEIPDLEDDSIIITLDEYFKFAASGITGELTDADLDEDTVTMINGVEAKSCEIEGDFKGQEVYYRLAVLSDETYFYQIIFWTFKDLNPFRKDDLFASIESFTIK